jgi:alpha-glucosidase
MQIGVKLVSIVEPSVQADMKDDVYMEAWERSIFIRNNQELNLLGNLWPGLVHFIDFTNPEARKFWVKEIKKLHDLL